MVQQFAVGDHVRWNSEAGYVEGVILKIHTHDVEYKGYVHHASESDPQYEIKSDKTDHIAMHKGGALTKLLREVRRAWSAVLPGLHPGHHTAVQEVKISVQQLRRGGRMTNRIYTVGHSTRDFDEMLAMLQDNEITHLVDVRAFPASRKFPQWNQPAIIGALPPDIEYRWIPQLGGRRHTPKGAPSVNGAWQVKAFRDYADYMDSDEFKEGLNELLELAEHGRPVIMCSEAVPWRCHRRLITDALIVAGTEVADILSATTVKPAVLHKHAQVQDGHLTYPPQA